MNPELNLKSCSVLRLLASVLCLLAPVLCLPASPGYAADQVFGNFETGLDGWTGAWTGTGDLGTSTTGATLGSRSMTVRVGPGDFWKLQHDGLLNLTDATNIKFDITFIASEWPGPTSWCNVNKIAIQDHSSWAWQEVDEDVMTATKISGADPPTTHDADGHIVYWQPSMGNATWTVAYPLDNIDKSDDLFSVFISLTEPNIAKASAGYFYIDNIRVEYTPTETTTIIGNWEGSNLDSWSAAWEGSPVLSPGNTNGITLGTGALSVTTNGGYWCLQRYSSPLVLENATLRFDLTMLASEWPSDYWTQVADKIAINSDGASGWMEWEKQATAINRDDETPASRDWNQSQGNARKTYSLDVSDYDYTGATWMQIAISIQGGNGSGHFYFDNALLAYPIAVEQPSRLYVEDNRIVNENGDDVVLRGVSLIDLGQQQQWKGGANKMIDRLTDPNDTNCGSVGWHTNVIRIPVFPPSQHQDDPNEWPYEFDPNNSDLATLLRNVVNHCAEKDCYAVIDWHGIDDMNSTSIAEANEFWDYMAPLFADDTHVIFELFNEPINSSGTDEENWAAVKAGMETLIATIRTYAPNTLLFVGTPRYSQIIGPTADDPLEDPNVVYVSHIYPYHWLSDYAYYTSSIAAAAEEHPVIMGEWGFIENDPTHLDGTITNYGEPLKEFVEGLGIGSIAWVAGYDWQPPMYDYNDTNHVWTLTEGEGYMGCFVKEWIHEGWLSTQSTNIALTINRCLVTAGATRGQDSFEASGTIASVPPNLLGISTIDVNIVSGADGNDIYTESCNFAWDIGGNRFIWSTSNTGQINLLILNFRSKTFVMKAQGIDLTGLGAPVHLDFTLGDFILSGDANEAIVNGSSSIPAKLMAGYKNSLDVKLGSASDSTASLKDNFYCVGNITARYIGSSNLAGRTVVITWANQSETVVQNFTLPAGRFSRVAGNSYKCTNALTSEGARVTATINLDACTFTVLVQNTNLSVTSGVKFGIRFTGFDKTDDITNLRVSRPSTVRRLRR